MTEVTDADYHLSFGLHSGIPLCCCESFLAGNGGGPCSDCQEKGIERKAFFDSLHKCHENDPTCQPFLDIIDEATVESYKRRGDKKQPDQKNYDKRHGIDDDLVWGCSLHRPMGAKFRDLLHHDGFRMVHLCWPEPSVYWYIFQQQGGKKGKCGICNTKFSLKFPTPGKQVQ